MEDVLSINAIYDNFIDLQDWIHKEVQISYRLITSPFSPKALIVTIYIVTCNSM